MRFLLCARDRGSGSITLLSGDAFATRREAVDAGALRVRGAVLTGCDLLLVDLETATPVLVMGGDPLAPRAVREAVAAAHLAPRDPEPVEERVDESPHLFDGLVPVADDAIIEEWPFVAVEAAGGVGAATLVLDRPDDDEERSGIRWLEAAADVDGRFDSEASSAGDDAPRTSWDRERAGEGETRGEEPLDADVASVQEPTDARLEPQEVGGWAVEETTPADETFVTFAYRGGPVDMTVWVCSDCVYITTCPKAHGDTPATCGAFQWKAT